MAGKRFLLVIAALCGLMLLASNLESGKARAGGSACSSSNVKLNTCNTSAGHDGTEVVIDGRYERPSGPSAPSTGSAAEPEPPAVFRDGYTVTMPVTLADVARFRPTPGTDHMQPDGWMIVGLHTNFFAHARQHVKSGTLLDEPAYVRFTPAQYVWTYGDGTKRTTTAKGATWKSLGLHEFDATATSHIYRNPGKYYIDLNIGYSPEYRFESTTEWIPLNGYVWTPANRLVAIAAAGAKTVLVEDQCITNPHGPGC